MQSAGRRLIFCPSLSHCVCLCTDEPQQLQRNGSSLLVAVWGWKQRLRARFGSSPSSFCCALGKVCLLEADEVKYWGLSDGSFCSGFLPHRVRAPRFADLSLSKMTALCHHWVHSQYQTGGGQDTRTSWEQSTDQAALQRDLSNESIPGRWKSTSGFGLPREDLHDDQGTEELNTRGQSWGLGALRGKSNTHLTGQEESQALHRGASGQDMMRTSYSRRDA